MTDNLLGEGELEEITCLSRVSRSLMVMAVDPSVVAAAVKEEDPDLEDCLVLEDPPSGLGG